MPVSTRKRLGDLLVGVGAITQDQLKTALERRKMAGVKLGQVIVSLGLISQEDMVSALADQLNMPVADTQLARPQVEALRLIPESLARKHILIPLAVSNGAVTVAMSDPLDIAAMDEISAKVSCEVKPLIASPASVMTAINRHYGFIASMDQAMLSRADVSRGGRAGLMDDEKTDTHAEQAHPVTKLVETLIKQAVKDRASDAHMEPLQSGLRVRFRIDGVMFHITTLTDELGPAIISRMKVMAKIDITQTRTPQEGGFTMSVDGKPMEFRVSTFPTIYGESAVIRVLRVNTALLGLEQTGLAGSVLKSFKKALARRQGIIIVTGPTGSGKTTTLCSALGAINSPAKTIVTVEDPVEYRLEFARQTEVNLKAGLTFATGLRSILRQDPDVIMIGEIRDGQSARIAIRAAMTGRLALTTMHTGDAVGVIDRMMDLGVEPSALAATLNGALAQRLVRRICKKCRGRGCSLCKKSGYYKRIGIFEFLETNDELREMIAKRATVSAIRKFAREHGLLGDMRSDGRGKARAGITSMEEADRAFHDNYEKPAS